MALARTVREATRQKVVLQEVAGEAIRREEARQEVDRQEVDRQEEGGQEVDRQEVARQTSDRESIRRQEGARRASGGYSPRDPEGGQEIVGGPRRRSPDAPGHPCCRGVPPEPTALERKLAALERQLAELAPLRRTAEHLEHKLAELSTLVADLQSRRSDDGGEALEDPFAWIRRDPSIVQYHGQHVALHPTRGVVAHGPRLDAVLAEVHASGLPLDDIVLDFIADSPF